MEIVQLKTVDPLSQELLKSAFQRGIKLSWDRWEKLQPQDGFLRLGLSCPFGCLHGPCRIDPFGRGAERGFCGMNKDQMAAAFLLRLTFSGVWEAVPRLDKLAVNSWPKPFLQRFSEASKKLGGKKISLEDLSRSVSFLERSATSAEILLTQTLRLALLAIVFLGNKDWSKKNKLPSSLTVGYGLLSQKEINIGVCGEPPLKFLKAAATEIKRSLAEQGQLIGLGELLALDGQYLPCVGTSGEAELVLTSGKINLLIAGPKTDPALLELCHTLSIPVGSFGELNLLKDLIKKTKVSKINKEQINFNPPPDLVEEVQVKGDYFVLKEFLRQFRNPQISFLGGDDHPLQTLGWIPTEVTPNLLERDSLVFLWGDAGLWMAKKGMLNPQKKFPLFLLHGPQGLILALSILAETKRRGEIKGIFFTGLKGCLDLALALGLAALGWRVGVAVPLPLWGSDQVRFLLQRKLEDLGGSLPHFDHPAQAEEILSWFKG